MKNIYTQKNQPTKQPTIAPLMEYQVRAKKAFLVLSTIVAASASGLSHAEENAAITWNKAILAAIRTTHPGPTVVARALNIMHTCMFDAWSAYDARAVPTRYPFTGDLRRPFPERTAENKQATVSYAAHRALVDLFPSEKSTFDSILASQGYDPTTSSKDRKAPSGIAKTACDSVLAYRHADGSNQLGQHAGGNGLPYSDYTGYKPKNPAGEVSGTAPQDPNRWEPLMVNGVTQKFLTPQWGKVKPFALKSIYQYQTKTPAAYGTPAYQRQVDEVIEMSANLDDRKKVIAEYWADGPHSELPPGHWNLFAQEVSRRDAHRLDHDVKMFFALNNALLDASIWAWGQKVRHDYVRPVSAVHYVYFDKPITAWSKEGGRRTYLGQHWLPYQPANVITPPFAEFVSGHSTFSAAAAEVLRQFTGSDHFEHAVTIPAGSSRVEPNHVPAQDVTLRWATFTDAANEAGSSRLLGGIHFRDGDLEGRRIGRKLGRAAFRLSALHYGDFRGAVRATETTLESESSH